MGKTTPMARPHKKLNEPLPVDERNRIVVPEELRTNNTEAVVFTRYNKTSQEFKGRTVTRKEREGP